MWIERLSPVPFILIEPVIVVRKSRFVDKHAAQLVKGFQTIQILIVTVSVLEISDVGLLIR